MEKARTAETAQRNGMERQGVEQPRDECPNLLRVPAPVTAPRNVRPTRAEKDARAQQHHRRHQQQPRAEHSPQGRLRRAHQFGQGMEEGKQQQGIGQHRQAHVQAQQRRFQHRLQSRERRPLRIERGHQEEEARSQQPQHPHRPFCRGGSPLPSLASPSGNQSRQHHHPRAAEHRFVAACHRQPSPHHAAQHDEHREQQPCRRAVQPQSAQQAHRAAVCRLLAVAQAEQEHEAQQPQRQVHAREQRGQVESVVQPFRPHAPFRRERRVAVALLETRRCRDVRRHAAPVRRPGVRRQLRESRAHPQTVSLRQHTVGQRFRRTVPHHALRPGHGKQPEPLAAPQAEHQADAGIHLHGGSRHRPFPGQQRPQPVAVEEEIVQRSPPAHG